MSNNSSNNNSSSSTGKSASQDAPAPAAATAGAGASCIVDVPKNKSFTIADLERYEHLIKIKPVINLNKHGGENVKLYLDDGTKDGREIKVRYKAFSPWGVSKYDKKKGGGAGKDSKAGGGDAAGNGGVGERESHNLAFPLYKKDKSPQMDEISGLPLIRLPQLKDRVAKREMGKYYNQLRDTQHPAQFIDLFLNSSCKLGKDKKKNEEFGPKYSCSVNPTGLEKSQALKVQIDDTRHKCVTSDQMKGAGLYSCTEWWTEVYFMNNNYGNTARAKSVYKHKRQTGADDEEYETTQAQDGDGSDCPDDGCPPPPTAQLSDPHAGDDDDETMLAAEAAATAAIAGQKRKAEDSTSAAAAEPPNKRQRV